MTTLVGETIEATPFSWFEAVREESVPDAAAQPELGPSPVDVVDTVPALENLQPLTKVIFVEPEKIVTPESKPEELSLFGRMREVGRAVGQTAVAQAIKRGAEQVVRPLKDEIARIAPPLATDVRSPGGLENRTYTNTAGDVIRPETLIRELPPKEEVIEQPWYRVAAGLLASKASFDLEIIGAVHPDVLAEAFKGFETDAVTPKLLGEMLVSLDETFMRRHRVHQLPPALLVGRDVPQEHRMRAAKSVYDSVRAARIDYERTALRHRNYGKARPTGLVWDMVEDVQGIASAVRKHVTLRGSVVEQAKQPRPLREVVRRPVPGYALGRHIARRSLDWAGTATRFVANEFYEMYLVQD